MKQEKKDKRDKSNAAVLPDSDHFDGHTSFISLSFTQKLTWLSEAAESVYALARENEEAGCNDFFK